MQFILIWTSTSYLTQIVHCFLSVTVNSFQHLSEIYNNDFFQMNTDIKI